MALIPNDGGPAFPQGHSDTPIIDPSGMTLRDYFAAKALSALVANNGSEFSRGAYAEEAYRIADAMLEERDRT